MNFVEILRSDPICLILLLVLIAAFFLSVYRFLYLHSVNIDSEGFLIGMKNNIKNKKIVEAIALCRDTNTPVSSVCESILSRNSNDLEQLRHAADEAAIIEIPKLQRNMHLIATLGQMAPMLGMLDTVICFLRLLKAIGDNQSGITVQLSAMSPFISKALVATAMGIGIGMIISLCNAILQERCHAITNSMERTTLELINFLTEPKDLADKLNGDISHVQDEENDN